MRFLRNILFGLLPISIFVIACNTAPQERNERGADPVPYAYAPVVHGGAGSMNFENFPEPSQEAYKASLDSALQLGLDLLEEGSAAIDAVEAVIRYLEDNPLYNAGKGAVFTSAGVNELDASIMTGSDLKADAVAGVKDIRHPITAARAVMEQSDHVMLSGEGASEFAQGHGLEIVDPSYFYTEERYKSLGCGPRHICADGIQGIRCGGSCKGGDRKETGDGGWKRGCHMSRPVWTPSHDYQHQRDVSRLREFRRQAGRRNLQGVGLLKPFV